MISRRLAFGLALFAALLIAAPGAYALNPNHECAFCHNVHNSPGQDLLQAATSEATCLSCHDPAAPGNAAGGSDIKVAVHTNKAGSLKAAFDISCVGCHEPHSSLDADLGAGSLGTSLKLVGTDQGAGTAQIATPNSGIRDVVFLSRGTDAGGPSMYSFADGDEDLDALFSGICEVCHTDTDNHENGTIVPDLSDHTHNVALNCTACHPHVDSFWGTGGECLDCHNGPQDKAGVGPVGGRRSIEPEFSWSSHHLTTAVTSDDCQVCHDQSQHQQGQVRLWNVDTGTTVAILSETVRPDVDATEAAKLTAFCLACHDSDGAAGAAPFSDAQMPPVIDETTWNSETTHNLVGTLSCFGDGLSFGCHDSGHGSQKVSLLAPSTVAPTAPANIAEEEGFCFNCHDSDGPSIVDAESAFNTAILWADDAVASGSATMNDRHDVQYAAQSTSGAVIECVNCHDPHTASRVALPLSLLRADPDPGDGRTPGSNWFEGLAGAGLGTDAQSEWCMDCHDGSFPTGVQYQSAGTTDILTEWLVTSHGAAGSAASLKTGANYYALDAVVPCLACHQPHPGTTPQPVTPSLFNNLFQMKDTIVGTDWTTVIPSDGPLYEITTLQSRGTKNPPFDNDEVNSYYLCNTCHTASMGSGKPNCFDCHTHDDSRF